MTRVTQSREFVRLSAALGHLIPLRLLEWAQVRFGWCWAKCAMLKVCGPLVFLRDRDSLRVTTRCFDARPEPYDYCNSYGPEHPCLIEVVRKRQQEGANGPRG